MAMMMEFWSLEVKAGEPVKVELPQGCLIHLSQAALDDSEKGEKVKIFAKIGVKTVLLGTLSSTKFPHLSLDIPFHKEFQLSHNSKSGHVHFSGWLSQIPADDAYLDMNATSGDNGKVEIPNVNSEIEDEENPKKVKSDKKRGASDSGTKTLARSKKSKNASFADEEETPEKVESRKEHKTATPQKTDGKKSKNASFADEEETPEKVESRKEHKTATPQKTDGKKSKNASFADEEETPEKVESRKEHKTATPQKTDGKKHKHNK